MLNLTETINLTHCFLRASRSTPSGRRPPLARVQPVTITWGPDTTLTDKPLLKMHSQDFSLLRDGQKL
ncbi:hypothetical protein AAY473_040601 [Plecturocebus cupreus]